MRRRLASDAQSGGVGESQGSDQMNLTSCQLRDAGILSKTRRKQTVVVDADNLYKLMVGMPLPSMRRERLCMVARVPNTDTRDRPVLFLRPSLAVPCAYIAPSL